MHFNSTIVRLRDILFRIIGFKLIHFNSTIVRLRDSKHELVRFRRVYFNSTIVRLREWEAKQDEIQLLIFQFNYCTIKRILISLQEVNCNDFNSTIVRLRVMILIKQNILE